MGDAVTGPFFVLNIYQVFHATPCIIPGIGATPPNLELQLSIEFCSICKDFLYQWCF